MGKKYYYLYVFYTDIYGMHNLIRGKLFFDSDTAIDEGKHYISIPGYHAQVVETKTNNIIWEG